MVTTIVDLEAIRAHLLTEAPRIRVEYETVLPDIEGDLAAVDRLLSRMPALAVAESALEATAETEFAARTARQPNWKRALVGLGQHEVIVTIAMRHGGTITVAQVADILVEMELTKATGPGARAQASHVPGESKYFERVGKGTYRLRAQSEPTSTERPEEEPTGL